MCIFTGTQAHPVNRVANTQIFARPDGDDRQILVYSMQVVLDSDTAMVLPLPVPAGSGDDAIDFIDLSANPSFFDQLACAFPAEVTFAVGGGIDGPLESQAAPLAVHSVGDFEASFVPSIADFDRLDPRFRLEPDVFAALPAIADWGFAVFKLRARRAAPPSEPARPSLWSRLVGRRPPPPPPTVAMQKIHPMALSFPTRFPGRLYFPTLHVHDGAVHDRARFDHALFCQRSSAPRSEAAALEDGGLVPDPAMARGDHGAAPPAAVATWERSMAALAMFMMEHPTAGVVDLRAGAYRLEKLGLLENRDTWVDA